MYAVEKFTFSALCSSVVDEAVSSSLAVVASVHLSMLVLAILVWLSRDQEISSQ
jgi:hypothetical protein